MKRPLILSALLVSNVFAVDGTNKLLKTGETNLELASAIKVQKQLQLNDAFVVQAYGQLRALGIRDIEVNNFFDKVFEQDFQTAIKTIPQVSNREQQRLINATKLYLYWKLNLAQSFVNEWINESSDYAFLDTQLGVALDQIISKDASQWLLKNAIVFDHSNIEKIDRISGYESKFNYSIQALRNLRRGELSLKWIKFLPKMDPLRIRLSESVILQFAREGRLADAAKVLKEVVEPALKEEENIEDLAKHHIILARLLYQAGAYEASAQYYSYIPDESKYFLTSQVESLWIDLRHNDLTRIKGKLASLELSIFDNKFNPEVYLISSMASLHLCQFKDVESAFNKFITVNKNFISQIDTNIKSQNPSVIDRKDFYIRQLTKAKLKRSKELDQLVKISATATHNTVFKTSIED